MAALSLQAASQASIDCPIFGHQRFFDNLILVAFVINSHPWKQRNFCACGKFVVRITFVLGHVEELPYRRTSVSENFKKLPCPRTSVSENFRVGELSQSKNFRNVELRNLVCSHLKLVRSTFLPGCDSRIRSVFNTIFDDGNERSVWPRHCLQS